MLIGGSDPLAITRQAPDRIAHTHLKDVDFAMAKRVRTGELTYAEAVRIGMYKPLGQGDVDIAGVVGHLEAPRLRRLVRAGAGHRPHGGADGRGAGR
jgi:inosose dehydratase